MNRLAEILRRNGFRKGVLGTDRRWFAIWAGVITARFVHRRLTARSVVVESMTLRPGETLVIRDTGLTWSQIDAGDS